MTQKAIQMFNALWLMGAEFPPIKYVVQGIIPQGVTLLVAPPKVGKSWFVLALAWALSVGEAILGGIPNERPRPVFYLALEDGQARLQSRLRHMGFTGSPLLEFCINLNGHNVIEVVSEWILKHVGEDPVVILDTLGKVMPSAKGNQNQYAFEYAVGSALKAACDAVEGASLIIVHHTNKGDKSDFVDSVSGTQGLAGSADSILVLKRERLNDRATLEVTSRDAIEGSYELVFRENCVWELEGHSLESARKAAEVSKIANGLGERMVDIIKVVNDHPEGITPTRLKELLPDVTNVDQYLKRAFETGRIDKLTRGLYTPVSSNSSVSFPTPETNSSNTTNTNPLSRDELLRMESPWDEVNA